MHQGIFKGFKNMHEILKYHEEIFFEFFEKISLDVSFIKDLQSLLVYDSFDFRSLFFYFLSYFAICFITSYSKLLGAKWNLKLGKFKTIKIYYIKF